MPIETVGDIDICYERQGSGPRLLYISGTGADLRNRPGVFDGPLAKAFDLLAYDQRGLGRTSKPDRPYSMADYADDAARLMDYVGWRDARVLGISFGGMVAQELALRHPDKVERLVLACTSPGGDGQPSYPLHQLQDLEPAQRARFMIGISDTRRDDAWARANPAEVDALVAMSMDAFAGEPDRAMGARRQLEARAGHDTWDRIGDIRCPTMIAAGRYDGIATPRAQENMASRIPGAELRYFDGGHLFMLQDQSALPAIVEFLQSADA